MLTADRAQGTGKPGSVRVIGVFDLLGLLVWIVGLLGFLIL